MRRSVSSARCRSWPIPRRAGWTGSGSRPHRVHMHTGKRRETAGSDETREPIRSKGRRHERLILCRRDEAVGDFHTAGATGSIPVVSTNPESSRIRALLGLGFCRVSACLLFRLAGHVGSGRWQVPGSCGNVNLIWPHRARLIWPHLSGVW